MINLKFSKNKFIIDFFKKKNYNFNNIYVYIKKYNSLFNNYDSFNVSIKTNLIKNLENNIFYLQPFTIKKFKYIYILGYYGFKNFINFINKYKICKKKYLIINKFFIKYIKILFKKINFKFIYIVKNILKFLYNFNIFFKKIKYNKFNICLNLGKINFNKNHIYMNYYSFVNFLKKKNIFILKIYIYTTRIKFRLNDKK